MDYQKVYRRIVERGQVREPIKGEYYETHHIVPKCMGGGEEMENLTALTAREHFISHWLLARIYPSHQGITYSFWSMCVHTFGDFGERYIPSSRAYEEAREFFSKNHSDKIREKWQDPEHRKKVKNSLKEFWSSPDAESTRKTHSQNGKRIWQDESYRSNQSDKANSNWSNPEYISKQMRSRSKEEYRKKLSDSQRKRFESVEERILQVKNRSLTDEQVREIRNLLPTKVTMVYIANIYGVSSGTIFNIKNNKTYWWVE